MLNSQIPLLNVPQKVPPTASLIPDPTQELPPLIPALAYRHASPSGPWPWRDLDYDLSESRQNSPEANRGAFPCPHSKKECAGYPCWTLYPQSLFPNWTPGQIKKSGIVEAASKSQVCTLYVVDVNQDGHFSEGDKIVVGTENSKDHTELLQINRPKGTLVRALFMDKLSLPVMQILGTKYNIEPFYFSSSLNRIPSRYQEDIRPGQGDHITITMSFMRANKVLTRMAKRSSSFYGERVNEQLALVLKSDDKFYSTLVQELMAIHIIRDKESSTIISYHTPYSSTSAQRLHSRVALAGESVYWQKIFQKSDDPTLVLLAMFWYPLYAWDESLATLWEHIGRLEIAVLSTHNILFTQELHKIRAHLLYYVGLLEDFRNAVIFVSETSNPVMDSWSEDEKAESKSFLEKECRNLITEIDRLKLNREMQDKRLKNVMDLAFSSVNAEDSRHMSYLTETSLKDSAAMKQISYLTMVFLPASFAAAVFGMNVVGIVSPEQGNGTVGEYLALALPLTAVTIWILIAFHGKFHTREGEDGPTLRERLCWPVISLNKWVIRLARKVFEIRPSMGREEKV